MKKLLPLALLFIFSACQSESQKISSLKTVDLVIPSGEIINTLIAFTPEEQEQGLSGVKPDEFQDNQGLLFLYTEEGLRHFWMPNTYFELDLFYLDKNLKVIDIIRKLPYYIGKTNPHLIPRARGVWCMHTLEMKSTSSIAQKMKIGDTLQWKAQYNLEESMRRLKEKSSF